MHSGLLPPLPRLLLSRDQLSLDSCWQLPPLSLENASSMVMPVECVPLATTVDGESAAWLNARDARSGAYGCIRHGQRGDAGAVCAL